jgi:polyketide biosynthesis acyl carrier protein
MTHQDVLDLVKKCICSILPNLNGQQIGPTDSLVALGANSIDRAEITVMALEELGLRIPLVETYGLKNIGELATLLHDKLQSA